MENQTIQATLRGKQSQGVLTRMRKSGQTAVSFSGRGLAPVSLYAPTVELESALKDTFGAEVQINIGFEGVSHLVRLAQVNRHPISRELLTVSLQKLAAE